MLTEGRKLDESSISTRGRNFLITHAHRATKGSNVLFLVANAASSEDKKTIR
jgi:hypothetical protein